MGATEFFTRATGTTAAEAFKAAVEEAYHECGHGGYTGSICEKRAFVMVTCPVGTDPGDLADKMINDGKCDKWGPACCIALGEGKYFFFGLASC